MSQYMVLTKSDVPDAAAVLSAAGLHQARALLYLGRGLAREALGNLVIARQVKVDDLVTADSISHFFFAWRRGLQQARRQVARLCQQEPADLRNVGASGDVDEVILVFRIERIVAGKVVQQGVDLFEIPGVT